MGESQVIKPGSPNTLTGPAKTILEKPTFLPDASSKAASYGGAKEASGFARVMQAGKIIPKLGAGLLAFGAGAAIGTEICGAIGIEGCWEFSSTKADPVEVETGHWVFADENGVPGVEPATEPFVWYWAKEEVLQYKPIFVTDPYESEEGACQNPEIPNGMTHYQTIPNTGGSCWTGSEVLERGDFELGKRYSMENRTFSHNATDDPEVENAEYTAPENWPDQTAAALEAGTPESNRVGEKIASEIEGSEVADPYATFVEVPTCDGLKKGGCVALLEELEVVPEVTELDWEDAVIDELDVLDPQKTREDEAERVIELAPPPETTIEVGTGVELVVNPSEEGMPHWVPQPGEGESADDYKEKKVGLPLVPSIEESVSGELINPDRGPGEVARTFPSEGTRLDPQSETGVKIYPNPQNAPTPAAAPWAAPNVPAIDASPLTGISLGCNSFPFGVFCWVADGLGSWSEGSGECPSVTLPFDSYDAELEYDFCTFEPAMLIIRPFIILLSAFGVAWLFAASAIGVGGGEADE